MNGVVDHNSTRLRLNWAGDISSIAPKWSCQCTDSKLSSARNLLYPVFETIEEFDRTSPILPAISVEISRLKQQKSAKDFATPT